MSVYTPSPLVKRLGLKPGDKIRLIGAPANYETLLGTLPEGVEHIRRGEADFIQLFTVSKKDLKKYLPLMKEGLKKEGALWVCWMNNRKGFESELSETLIRKTAQTLGLSEVKGCDIDEYWTGLKFMIRK